MPSPTVADGTYDLRYKLERADIAAFLSLKTELRGLMKLAFFLPFIAAGAMLGYFEDTETGIALGLQGEWVRFALLGVAVIALLAFKTLFMSIVRNRSIRLAAVPPGEIHLVATRAGIRLTHAGKMISHGWEEILNVVRGNEHVFLVTAPKVAIIVPLRAFRDYEHMLRFVVFADENAHLASDRADARPNVVQRARKR